MNITLLAVVLAVYFVGMVGIGLLGRRYAASFDTFVSAGRNAGVLMIIGSAVGSQIGNGFVVGGAGSLYTDASHSRQVMQEKAHLFRATAPLSLLAQRTMISAL